MASTTQTSRDVNEALPTAIATERELLGYILVYGKIPEGLTSDSFSLHDHRKVFNALDTLFAKGLPITGSSAFEEMGQPDMLCDCGALEYLAELARLALPDVDTRHYVNILNDKAARRRIIIEAASIAKQAHIDTCNPVELAESAATFFHEMKDDAQTQPHIIENLPSVWSYTARVEWMVNGILAVGTVLLLTGESGVGKSILSLQLAGCVAHGQPFLDHPVVQRQVLFVDRENPLFIIKERLEFLGIPETPNLIVWGTWNDVFPDGPGAASILRYAREHKPLIVFDALVAFHGGNEQDASETRKHMTLYRMLASAGATVVILHNTGKAENSKQYRGSSDIKASVDAALLLESVIPGQSDSLDNLRLTPFKTRFSPMKPTRLQFVDGRFEAMEAPEKTPFEKLEDVLRLNPNINGKRLEELTRDLGVSKGRLQDLLLEGIKSGRIVVESGPRGSKKHRLAEPEL